MTKSQRIALIVLLLAGFITIFDLYVVNVAMISIERSLGASLTELTLIIVAYELAFGLLLITGGRLGDIFGRRTLYRYGMLAFTLTSVLCAVSPTITFLIGARFLQGLSAALLFPQIYASIRLNFDESGAKKAFGYLGMSLGLAAIAGQAIGGILIGINLFGLGWRLIFLINVPIGLITLLLSKHLQNGQLEKDLTLDMLGVVLSSMGIMLCLLPLLMIPIWGWGFKSTAILIIGALFITLFLWHETLYQQRGKSPLLVIEIFANRAFVLGICIVLSVYITSSAFPMMMTILLQKGFLLTPFQSGMIFIPSSMGFIISSLSMHRWQNHLGNKVFMMGALCYASSFGLMIAFSLWMTRSGFSSKSATLLFSPVLFMIGFAKGVVLTPLLNLVLSTVTEKWMGMASGLTATFQQIGAALGVTAIGVILQIGLKFIPISDETLRLESAFRYGTLFMGSVMIIASFLLHRLLKSH